MCLSVPTLAVPDVAITDIEAQLGHSAVRLFIERARIADARLPSLDANPAIIASICRRLDGIPLAIELAAARAVALGVRGVADGLDDRFRLLAGGRRTALPRHQTLRATLDWSYGLLTETERVVLRRLVTSPAASSWGPPGRGLTTHATARAESSIARLSLVAKSLVTRDGTDVGIRYRLLDTTRAYALEKLARAASSATAARRHAEYSGNLFARAEAEWETRPTDRRLADHGRQIDNVRAALDWAFSPTGDAAIGVALTAAAVPVWMHLSLMEECRGRVERALDAVAAGAGGDARREMRLHARSLIAEFTRGAVSEVGAAGAGRSRSRKTSVTPSISCARSGACGPFTSIAASIAPL